MKPWLKCLALPLLLAPALPAAEDELAGEKESIARPAAKPTMAEPDQSGPINLSRSAKSAGEASFELPEFVIKAGGERKAVSRRPDLSSWMDTSGGIKASPSEAEASKGQLGSQAGRQTLAPLTETSRPAYGQGHILYGAQNTLEAGAFYGQELDKFYYLLQGKHDSSDGGPAGIPVVAINQSRHDSLAAHGGLRLDNGAQLGLELGAKWRERLLTRIPLPAPRTERSLYDAALGWEGQPGQQGLRQRYRLSASKSQALLPGLGSAYGEGLVRLDADFEKELFSRRSRTVVLAHLYGGQSDQNQGDRLGWLAGGWFMARIEAWKGARLSLGLSLDSLSGGSEGLLFAPRAEFDQRLGSGLGVWASFRPSMHASAMNGALFDTDLAFPGTRTRPQKDSVDLEAGISAALPHQLGLELKGGLKQNEDGLFLDDSAGTGLWQEANVRSSRTAFAELSEQSPLSGEFSQKALVKWQQVELLDSLGLKATFSPALQAEAWLQWKRDEFSAGLGALFAGEREGRLKGGDTMEAYTDLRLRGAWEGSERLTLIAEIRNLAFQRVQQFSGYADPAPMAGLGAEFKF